MTKSLILSKELALVITSYNKKVKGLSKWLILDEDKRYSVNKNSLFL